MPKSFCESLVESFESRPDAVAMRIVGSDAEICTYGQLLRQVRSVAYRLRQEKVEFGDRVALIGENHPQWASAYLGTLMIGAVIVPLDPHGAAGLGLKHYPSNPSNLGDAIKFRMESQVAGKWYRAVAQPD